MNFVSRLDVVTMPQSYAEPFDLKLARFHIRDFEAGDRDAFLSYQADPRYLALYGVNDSNSAHASALFDLFLQWQGQKPRTDFQLGIFDLKSGALYGCVGLRDVRRDHAVFGIELSPDQWGRFALVHDITEAMLDFGFGQLGLTRITGSTASGNSRVEKLARWFGASIIASREGPAWMTARGWNEIDWAIEPDDRVRRNRKRLNRTNQRS